MTQKALSNAKDPDLIASVAAMKRAAALARKIAVQTDTCIVVLKEQKLVRISAAELINEETIKNNSTPRNQ